MDANFILDPMDPVEEVEDAVSRQGQKMFWAIEAMATTTLLPPTSHATMSADIAELHQQLLEPISKDILSKIWKTNELDSHAHEESIEILYWTDKAKLFDEDIQYENKKGVCGPCRLTVDKSNEKSADAIIISKSQFLAHSKV